MTATSPYAPIRRQSSSFSSSRSPIGLIGSSAFLWTLASFTRRIISCSVSEDGNDKGMRGSFDALSNSIKTSLTVAEGSDELTLSSRHMMKISTLLRWIINMVGGHRSNLGRLLIGTIAITREVLLRSVGVTSIILTGVPSSRLENQDKGVRSLVNASMRVNEAAYIENKQNVGGEETNLQLVHRDRCAIDKVLNYWFGQASPDGAQKSLWMIASSSQELLAKVDSEISEQFRALVWDLFSSSLGHESDIANDEIGLDSLKFDKGKLHRWTTQRIFGWQGKIAAIIALDQMSRHIQRHDTKGNPMPTLSCANSSPFHIPEQEKLDNIAFIVSKQLQTEHAKELSTGMIPLPMRVFGIMPLRHASTMDNLTIVQNDIESMANLHEEMDKMLRRFRKATNRRMNILQDEARRDGKVGVSDGMHNGTKNRNEYDDEQILENFPFDADMSGAHQHVVVKTIRDFLRINNVLQTSDPRLNSSRKMVNYSQDTVISNLNNNKGISECTPTAIVSLSGGVDSMVIASALAYIRDSEAIKRNTEPDNVLLISTIHIDYGNRPESGAEAAYVQRFSNKLGAKFICRRIDEVTRGVTARDDYERIAREIRFDLYRQCSSEAAKKCSNGHEGNVGVMLGHHRGDLRENVISNAHKGCGPLDLSGMTAVSKNDGVTLFRPLLPLEKTSVFDYAHTFGVPYFKDTTPHWSTRGKLRNRLLPLLEEIYGEGSMDNLSSLAEESDEARAFVQQSAMGPFMNSVKYHPMGLTFETSQWKQYGLFFWKFVLRNVLHSAGRGMFSDKSVESFLERIRAQNLKEGWLQCRKDYAVYMRIDGTIFVFHPNGFPFHKKDQYQLPTGSVEYGRTIHVGPWRVLGEIVPDEVGEDVATKLLKERAVDSMKHLMHGSIQYYLQLPIDNRGSMPNSLVFVKNFTKPTRPIAWKGFDLKVEQTLPLLGIDHSRTDNISTDGVMQYGETWVLGKVQLTMSEGCLKM